ncbi:MAG: peptide chain release factor 1, partial [Nanoarchaeota archaeon]|nr:peptide chain release factor 1 [Nanoarchaeota archaeon]
MDLKEKLALKRFIRPLLKIRGRHTELVSVYIPVDYDIIKIIQQLQEEAGTATNIKDARTRNNVVDSLGRVINHLRLYKRTPPHGLAVFAGNVSEKESKVDIQVFSIEPPVPINQKIYRCDQNFKLDILEAMLEEKDFYALILV